MKQEERQILNPYWIGEMQEIQTYSFRDKIGLDYVSCSPYLVPVARLAAAQAAIKNK